MDTAMTAKIMAASASLRTAASERARRASLARKTKALKSDGHGHPTTSEIDYSRAEVEFFKAVDEWKDRTGRKYPTLSEILRIARGLGYRKGVEPVDQEDTVEFDTKSLAQAIAEAEDRAARERLAREEATRRGRIKDATRRMEEGRAERIRPSSALPARPGMWRGFSRTAS